MEVMHRAPVRPALRASLLSIADPLDEDRVDDEKITTTRKAINRVALIAAEAGGRFQREQIDHDPMSWLLAPRKMFDGRAAVDACLEREHCLRGILVHGLSLGLDIDPAALDTLLADDDDWEEEAGEMPKNEKGNARHHISREYVSVPRLYTATICYADNMTMLNAFYACITNNPSEIADHLEHRYGPAAAAEARIRAGYFAADPLVLAIVPDPLAEVICKMQEQESDPASASFAVNIEQRIEH